MSWLESKWLAFDLESTGVNHETDLIATAAAVVVQNGQPTYQKEWVVAVDMPEEASKINGLTTQWLHANGRPPAEVISEIVKALRYAIEQRMPIVAYNGVFDFSFTDRALRRLTGVGLEESLDAPIFPVLDPFVCWKEVVERRRGTRQLGDACEAFGVELGANAHQAAPDAIAGARVMLAIARKFPRIARMSLPELHAAQVEWRAEQCASLRAYFDSMAPPKEHDGVPACWPMHPFAEAATAVLA